MTSIFDRICSFLFEPQAVQPTVLPEGTIRVIPADILECIMIYANQSKNTRLVSHHWKDLTFLAFKNSKMQELKQTIRLITEHLDPRKDRLCMAELVKIDALQFLPVNTFVEGWRLFLYCKNSVISKLLELNENKRVQLQKTISSRLPDSMKDVFSRLAKLQVRIREESRELAFTPELASVVPFNGII